MDGTSQITGFAAALLAAAIVAAPITAEAAAAPKSPEKLKQQAETVVADTVTALSSGVEKSKVETAPGVHIDRVYTITQKITSVSKGETVAAGDEIEIAAWQLETRDPPLPGLQGHEFVPKQGDTIIAYLKGKDGGAHTPIVPNGMQPMPQGK